jgi:photosystem II PsbW protein
MQQAAKKAAAAVASVPALLAASPAFALVDDRLNGDGTGLPVGVNDPALTTAILGAFFLVWVLWYSSQKDLGDDAGLDL